MSLRGKEKYPSTFTVDNFSSTNKLADGDFKISKGSVETINKDDLYNPFDHRGEDGVPLNTTWGSLAHLLKSSLGTGILAMPIAFKNGGLISGFIGTVITGILCTHCVHLLVSASHEICKKTKTPSYGFSETAGAVFAHGPQHLRKFASPAKTIVDIALVVTYFLGGSVYIVFIADSLKIVFGYYYPDVDIDKRLYMVMIMVPIMLSCQLRELKYLVPFSFTANLFMVVSFAITLYFIFSQVGEVDIDALNWSTTWTTFPKFFSIVIFAMEGIGVVMPVENTMQKPQQFLGCPGVLNIAMSVVVVLYATIGLCGYMVYGDKTEGSVTYNLPNEPLAQSAKLLIAGAVFFTYSLQFHVPMDITWRKVFVTRIPPKWHNVGQVGIRCCIIAGSTVIAVAVPELEPIIGLVGAVCFSTLGLLIPAVVDTVLNMEGRLGIFKWRLIKNAIIGTLAIIALFSGSYFAIEDLIEKS